MDVTRNFRSLSEWIDYSELDHPNDYADRCASKNLHGKGFSGVDTKAEAYKLFRGGYPEGLARMKRVMEGITSNVAMPTTRDIFLPSVEGCAPNIEAYIQGIPEDMFVISQIEETAPPSNLTVQFELAYSAMISPAQAMLGGAIVFAAMEMLRVQGCNVTALLAWTSSARESKWQCTVPVPSTTDMDTLGFLFAHPAVLRRIIFAMMEHEPADVRSYFGFGSGSYGSPSSIMHPDADASISMQRLCMGLHATGSDGQDYTQAQRMLQELVDTRFGTFKPEAVNNA